MNRSLPFLSVAALLLAGCASPDVYLLDHYASQDTISSFVVCKNYGCGKTVTVSLSDNEWGQLRAVFAPSATNAAEERERIRHAIALMETIVGPKAGTANDKAGAELILWRSRSTQRRKRRRSPCSLTST